MPGLRVYLIEMNETLESIEALLEERVADYFILDNSVIGEDFLRCTRSRLEFGTSSEELEDSLRSSRECLRILRAYRGVSTVPIVLEEFNDKINRLKIICSQYSKNLGLPQERVFFDIASVDERIKDLLIYKISEARKTADLDLLHFSKRLVISANGSSENLSDESIIGEAIYLAFSNKCRVAIVTKDGRFPSILRKTKNLIKDSDFNKLNDLFIEGNLSIILGPPHYQGNSAKYKLVYCSKDF